MTVRLQSLMQLLAQAGFETSANRFFAIFLLEVVVIAAALFIGVSLDPLLAILAAIVAATLLTTLFLKRRIAARRAAFLAVFPEAIELIIRSVNSGLPVAEAFNSIATELEGPVGTTFGNIAENVAIGVSLTDALWSAAEKIGLQEFRFFVIGWHSV